MRPTQSDTVMNNLAWFLTVTNAVVLSVAGIVAMYLIIKDATDRNKFN